jgi:replicative DNA helicase
LIGSVKARLKKVDKEVLLVKYMPTGEATIGDIESHLKRVIAKYKKPDYVVIDYGDLLKGLGKFANGYEEQGWIFRRLKGLALKYDIPIWSATQATRLALSRKIITMEHIADSIEKARVANFIVAICQTADEKALNLMRFFIAKARNTMSGIELAMKISYSTDYIRDDVGRNLVVEKAELTSSQQLKEKMLKKG